MRKALIGNTGLVGSNLSLQRQFSHHFRSVNIDDIQGQTFSELVCAGVSGFKWEVNRNPQVDRDRIKRLLDCLHNVRAERFILISTIDVYGNIASGRDEDYDPLHDSNHPYGAHRQHVEREVRRIFPDALIVRLPGIFGQNLKKNLIFDLLHANALEMIDPLSAFQWYDLARLSQDIEKSLHANLKVVNLFPQPLETRSLVEKLFSEKYEVLGNQVVPRGRTTMSSLSPRFSARYNLKTKHGSLFGSSSSYLFDETVVLHDLARFIESESGRKVA